MGYLKYIVSSSNIARTDFANRSARIHLYRLYFNPTVTVQLHFECFRYTDFANNPVSLSLSNQSLFLLSSSFFLSFQKNSKTISFILISLNSFFNSLISHINSKTIFFQKPSTSLHTNLSRTQTKNLNFSSRNQGSTKRKKKIGSVTDNETVLNNR